MRFDPQPSEAPLPALPTDLAWVWFALLTGLALTLVLSLIRPRASA
jgi:hypothetical protein